MTARDRSGLLRLVGIVSICVLGYWAPWSAALGRLGSGEGTGPNAHLWGALAVALAKTGTMAIPAAFQVVLALGIALAFAAALLRTLGAARGRPGAMAWGTVLHAGALGLLMPSSGAVFAVVLVAVLELWFARAARVQRRSWTQAIVREVYMWGVAGSFAVAGWGYNAGLLVRCVLVSFGVGLVVRGALPEEKRERPGDS